MTGGREKVTNDEVGEGGGVRQLTVQKRREAIIVLDLLLWKALRPLSTGIACFAQNSEQVM